MFQWKSDAVTETNGYLIPLEEIFGFMLSFVLLNSRLPDRALVHRFDCRDSQRPCIPVRDVPVDHPRLKEIKRARDLIDAGHSIITNIRKGRKMIQSHLTRWIVLFDQFQLSDRQSMDLVHRL